MPVSGSDPRRASIIGVAGVVVGVVMIAGVLIANNVGSSRKSGGTPRKSEFDAGVARQRADDVRRAPLLFQDPATFTRPIYLQHSGADPAAGWLAFDASVPGCRAVIEWRAPESRFVDCNGQSIAEDGGSQHHYPVRVDHDHVLVDLNPDSVPTTAPPTTTTSITITGH